MMTIFKLTVKERDPKKLGSFLLKNGFSRQAINKSKNNGGQIFVNHKRRYTSYHLNTGDEVIFVTGKEKENPFLHSSKGALEIVKETDNYLIVNKSAGVLSIPSRYEDDDAVVNRVMGYFEQKGENYKPHVITRLDRNTSGLVLIGKNAVAHARFSKLDKNHFIKKYHAIVAGNFSENELSGLIDAPIGKKGSGVKRSVIIGAQEAQTEYQVLEQKENASLVELRLLTGRTHQIRVHMAYMGHPLYGDNLYNGPNNFPRQALNCFYLEFIDPFSHEKVKIQIQEPIDMVNLWDRL